VKRTAKRTTKAARTTLESLLAALMRAAERKGAVLYSIRLCKAGWGIQWHEEARERTPGQRVPKVIAGETFMSLDIENMKTGLVVYHYHRTLRAAVLAEMKRVADAARMKSDGAR